MGMLESAVLLSSGEIPPPDAHRPYHPTLLGYCARIGFLL